MYEHPIYKSAVLMEDQSECDLAKDLCIKYDLPIWEEKNAFQFQQGHKNYFFFYTRNGENHFYVDILDIDEITDFNLISLEDFEVLCEELAPEQDIDEIISKIKELNNIVNKNP